MSQQIVKAQDVAIGDVIKIDAYGSIEVANIIGFKTHDGDQAFSFWSPRGYRVWNRKDEELIKLN